MLALLGAEGPAAAVPHFRHCCCEQPCVMCCGQQLCGLLRLHCCRGLQTHQKAASRLVEGAPPQRLLPALQHSAAELLLAAACSSWAAAAAAVCCCCWQPAALQHAQLPARTCWCACCPGGCRCLQLQRAAHHWVLFPGSWAADPPQVSSTGPCLGPLHTGQADSNIAR
jgi:hypothetical protein